MPSPAEPGGSAPTVSYSFLGLDPADHTYARASVVVQPVPYDATASFRAGAREGPDAIIAASRELEDYDLELRCEPSSVGIHTNAALEPHFGDPKQMVQRVAQAVRPVIASGKLPVLLGGDHSVSVGAVLAMKETYASLSVLYLDAHADFRDEYLGTRWGHASSARRISELCPVTLVGVRSMSQEEAEALGDAGVSAFQAASEEASGPWDSVVGSLTDVVYVSVDLDVFDPSLMPSVGTPEPGGMGWTEVPGLLRSVAERRHIVGFDVVELAPREGPASCAYIAAKLVYKLIGYSKSLGTGA